jgi:Spy/CpxP family protein refolding chaperone
MMTKSDGAILDGGSRPEGRGAGTKPRKRNAVVLATMLCVAGTAFAQAPPPASHADWQAKRQQWEQKWKAKRAEMQQKRMDRLAVLLDMTPAQKQQVQAIFTAQRAQMQQAMKQAMEARRTARTETETKLGQVLSPTQMKKLKLLMPDRHRRFFMRRGPMGPMGPMGMGGPGMWHPHKGHAGGPPPPPPPDAGSQ